MPEFLYGIDPKEAVGMAGPDFAPGALRFQKCFIGLCVKKVGWLTI